MVSDTDMMEEIDARLAAVADTQFILIQRYREQIEAAADVETLTAVAEPLDRSARSIRLTYALRVKLRKDVRALARDEERIAEAQAERRARERDDRIRHRVETLTWREADWEDDDELSAEFDRALEYEDLDPVFATLTLEQQAERIIKRLDLKPEPYPHQRAGEPPPHDTT
ncbi:hypothetical protein [Phenylobacterium sp.]|uniref:hypothetical protein n=1 Tax=Phenylobacterium sp. TaxID=1871053 RepID=UPI0028116FEA|nr:hypothetical protein [Phenylobacterium sp.]